MWNLQDLSTSIWALAKLNIGNRKLLDLIHDRVVVDLPVLSAKDISYQMWGFAMLGYPLQRAVVASYVVRTPTCIALPVLPVLTLLCCLLRHFLHQPRKFGLQELVCKFGLPFVLFAAPFSSPNKKVWSARSGLQIWSPCRQDMSAIQM